MLSEHSEVEELAAYLGERRIALGGDGVVG